MKRTEHGGALDEPPVVTLESTHNRWHPAIPPVLRVAPGTTVALQTRDGLDEQFDAQSDAADVLQLDDAAPHPLTGPIYVEGAEPGDVLEVNVVSVTPDPTGVTVVIPGLGLLGDRMTDYALVNWKLDGAVATSASLPGVRVPAAPFVGVMGVAPSPEALAAYRQRELDLQAAGATVPTPEPRSAQPSDPQVAEEGLRTIPPREIGGNLDIRQLGAGSRLYLPVQVEGAHFSLGDVHVAQGDGEVCSFAIESGGSVTVRFEVHKADAVAWDQRSPAFEFTTDGRRRFATTGLPVDEDGRLRDLDVRLAAENAIEQMISYLVSTKGYTRAQAYAICSVAVDLRISSIVNVPTAVVSAVLPLEIFEEDAAANGRRRLQELLTPIAAELRANVGASRVTVRLFDEQRALGADGLPDFPLVAEACADGMGSLFGQPVVRRPTDAPGPLEVLESTRAVLVQDDVETSPPAFPEIVGVYGVRAQMLHPIVVDDVFLGLVSVHHREKREWTDAHVQALEACATAVTGLVRLATTSTAR